MQVETTIGSWEPLAGITRVFAEAGAAMRPRQVCEALGISTEARFIEAVRPGLFAPTVAAG